MRAICLSREGGGEVYLVIYAELNSVLFAFEIRDNFDEKWSNPAKAGKKPVKKLLKLA